MEKHVFLEKWRKLSKENKRVIFNQMRKSSKQKKQQKVAAVL